MPFMCQTHRLAAQCYKGLFEDGLSIGKMAKQFEKSEDEIRTILKREIFNLSKAELPKELKAYELVVLKGLSPSLAARHMNTGEEDIRSLLLNLAEEYEEPSDTETETETDTESESSSDDGIQIQIINLTSDSSSESSSDEEEEVNKPTQASKHVRIYFDHKNEEDGRDILTITNTNDKSYNIDWVYGNTDTCAGTRHAVYVYTNRDVIKYVRNMLQLIHADEKPYSGVEFQIPGYPSISLTPRKLKKSLLNILVAIRDNFVDV